LSFTFDGPSRLIYVESPTEQFDVLELYSDWKRWVMEGDNSKYVQAMRSIGGEPISDTMKISPYIEVLNDWRIKPYSGDYELVVTGNIFATGGINPFVPADDGTVTVKLEVSSNSLTADEDCVAMQEKLDEILLRIPSTYGVGFV